MTVVTKNSAPSTFRYTIVPDKSMSVSIYAKQGIKVAWQLFWLSVRSLKGNKIVEFTVYEDSRGNCSAHSSGYPYCNYDNPNCVWTV